jgi:hypothetical protein
MSAVAYCPDVFNQDTSSNHELFEIHHSKISLHCAKVGYKYPTIRLPHTFSKLAGLSTRIYQTIHEGSLAFLTVISPTENASKTSKSSVLTWRRSPVRIRPIPLIFDETAPLKASVEVLSVARIMAKNEHEEEKKLHNSSGADEVEPADSDLTQHAENDLNEAP